MITGAEMAVVDANAEDLGISQKQLMESSGNAIAREVRASASLGDTVTIVAGRGNNGGDGFVAARFLEEFDVRVVLLGRPETITTDIARANWNALGAAEIPTREVRDSTDLELGDAAVFVDAILGTGIAGSLREPAASAARAMNESDATVISVDVPSGLDTQSGEMVANAVSPDRVVTFHDTKPGLAALDAPVTVADIGIPDAAQTFTGAGDLKRIHRDPESHKGDHGEILIIGGGPFAGAPALAAQAALRAGVDLVRVACPAGVSHEIQGYSENLIVRRFDAHILAPEHVNQLRELAAGHDAIVVGPGLGDDEATLDAVQAILSGHEGRAVVDADALQIVPDLSTDATLVCTPHQGELIQMGGQTADDWRARRELVESFAADLGQTLVVKGAYDIVSDGDTTRVNRTGNPGMTVGGTGDVLAGVTGALLATQAPIHAGSMGTYITGEAGDIVHGDRGDGLVATDVIDAIPTVIWG